MKKLLALSALILVMVCMVVSCNNGQSDKDDHAHSFGEWTVTKEASCTENGTKTRSCSCGEKETAAIDALGHTPKEAVEENRVEAGCTSNGSYDSVIYCGVEACKAEISRKTNVISALKHNYVDGVCIRCNEEKTSEGLEFTSNGDETCYVSGIGTCTDMDVIIPTTSPNGDIVTSIGDSAFRGCTSLTSIVIPDSVTSIGGGAFSNCGSLQSITIPFVGATKDGTSNTHFGYIFGASSYSGNSSSVPSTLKTVIITGGTSIGSDAFYNCTSLTSIEIPDCVTSIGSDAFYNCTSLTSIHISDIAGWCEIEFGNSCANPLWYAQKLYLNNVLVTDLIIPDGVTSIGSYAFRYCESLTSIEIPDSVTSIGEEAFRNCTSLTSVVIGNSVTYIGQYAFRNCTSLTSVVIGNSVTYIGQYAFRDCTSLTSIEIPDSVTSIGNSAFQYCSSLTSIEIPNSVTSIGNSAFYNCTSLTSIEVDTGNKHYTSIDGNLYTKDGKTLVNYAVGKKDRSFTIPDGVTRIGSYAFSSCTSLTSIVIPDSVTSIGEFAFFDCTSLTSIEIPDSVTSIGSKAFRDCTSLTSIELPDSITSIGSEAFYNTGYYNNSSNWENGVLYIGKYLIKAKNTISGEYVIKNGTKVIAPYAFSYCASLTSVAIGDSVTSIGDSAFNNCTSLTSVVIGESVTSIYSSAFYNTGYYNNSSNWENGVLYIGNYLIRAKTTISGEYVIKNGTKVIADDAFRDCRSLTSVVIGDSVTSIGSNAFYNCTSLTDVYIKDVEAWLNISFGNDYAHPNYYRTLHIIDESGNEVTELVIPDSITSISDYAFYNCTSLTSIEIPDSVTSIGSSAFSNCTSLTSIEIPDSVTSIGSYTFYNCTSLTSIVIGDSVTSIGEYAFENTGYYNDSSNWENGVLYIGNYLIRAKTTISGEYVIKNGTKVIAPYAFSYCARLTSVAIGDSVKSIGYEAFYHCTSLTRIDFGGTKAQWNAISKGYNWNYNTGNYTVYCTDGEITK